MSFLGAPPPLPGGRGSRGRGRGRGRGPDQQPQYYKTSVHGQLRLHAQEAEEAAGRVEVRFVLLCLGLWGWLGYVCGWMDEWVPACTGPSIHHPPIHPPHGHTSPPNPRLYTLTMPGITDTTDPPTTR